MLPESEVDCIKEAVGETVLGVVLEMEITTSMASSPAGGFIFDCVSEENTTRVGVALVAAEAGLSDETAACMLDVPSGNPEAMKLRLGRLHQETTDTDASHLLESGFAVVLCLSQEEAESTFIHMYIALDKNDTLRGRDILAMLSESETACVHNSVEDDVLAGIQDATVNEALAAAEAVFDCITPENLYQIFITVTDSRLGGVSAETRTCIAGILEAAQVDAPHPHLIEFSFGLTDEAAPEHLTESGRVIEAVVSSA